MATAKINVCVDEGTKRAAEAVLDEMGLTMTAAINMYLKRIVRDEAIPFEVTARVPNATTIAAIKECEEIKKNPSAYKRYSTFKEAMDEVLNDV
jgi:DNA-damage-inducible protein J